MVKDFHHFKGNDLNRSEKVQRRVVELLLKSSIPDEKRESSIIWELKHSSGCCQIARILAQKRNLDVELAEIIGVLHDIHVVPAMQKTAAIITDEGGITSHAAIVARELGIPA